MKYSAELKPKMHPSDSETFCLKWNDFLDNVITSFAQLRKDKDFADVTLASGDGGQTVVRAHRVVLASGSHVLKSLLTQHPSENPLIFMRGMKQDQLNSIVDFLYFGERFFGLSRGAATEGSDRKQEQRSLQATKKNTIEDGGSTTT